MKKTLLIILVLFSLTGFSQESEKLRKSAMQLFDEGKLEASLTSLEKIQDKEVLENTNINLWKEHLQNIQNLKFAPNQNYNKKNEIVSIRTGLLEHYGVYDAVVKQFKISPIYDKIDLLDGYQNGFLVHKENKVGLCNIEGKFIIPLDNQTIEFQRYSEIINVKQFSIGEFSNDFKSAIYDVNGKLLLDNAEIIFDYYSSSIIAVKNDKNLIQVYDVAKNKIVLENCSSIKFVSLDYSGDFNFLLIRKDNQSFIFNIKTNELQLNSDFDTVIDMDSEDVKRASYTYYLKNRIKEEADLENFLFVKKNSKTGIYNLKQNKYMFPAVYDSISPLLNCLKENEWKNLIYNEPIRKALGYSIEGLRSNLTFFVFSKNGKYGVSNISGDKRLESEYDEVDLYSNILVFRKEKKWGFLGPSNEFVQPKFDCIESYGNSIKVYLGKKCYNYQYNYAKKRYYITRPKNEDDPEREAELKEYRKKKDPNYVEYSDLDFDGDNDRKIKRKMMKRGNLYGIADLRNNEIIPPVYKSVHLVGDKFQIQTTDACGGLLDQDGKEIIPFVYSGVNLLKNNVYLVYDGLKCGLYDIARKKEIIPPVYKYIKAINDNLFLAMDDQEFYGVIDKENEIIYPFTIQPYGLTDLRSDSNDFFVLSSYKDSEFSVASLIKITNGKATDVFDKEVLSKCFLGYSKSKLLMKEKGIIRFYDIRKSEFLDSEFKESIYIKEEDRYLLKKDQLFDYQIYRSEEITKRINSVVGQWGGYSLYEENNKMGLINKMGEKSKAAFPKVLFLNYVPRPKTLFKYYLSTMSEQNGLIDFDGNIVVEAEKYDDIQPVSRSEIGLSFPENKYKVEEMDYIFVCTDKSNPEYDTVDYISLSGRKIATQKIEKGYKWNYVRNQNGLMLFKSKDAIQIFDLKAGKTVLKTKSYFIESDYIRNIFTNLYYADEDSGEKGRRIQLINKNGDIVADELFTKQDEQREHKKYGSEIKKWENPLITSQKNKYGIISFDGKIFSPFVYDTIGLMDKRTRHSYDFFLKAEKNHKKGLLDTKGRVLLDIKYDDLELVNLFKNKEERDDTRDLYPLTFTILVKEKNKFRLLNSRLNPILETDFDQIQIDSKIVTSPIIARKIDYSFVFDSNGRYQFKVKCDSLRENYKLNYYEIFKDGKQAILDAKGNLIFDYIYPNVRKIEIDNLYITQKDDKEYLIDDKGKILSDGFKEIKILEYNTKENYNVKLYSILTKNQNNKVGIIDSKGNTVIANEYDSIEEISDLKYIHAIKDGKYGILDFNNTIVLPFKYTDRIYYRDYKKSFDCKIENINFTITSLNIKIEERYSKW